MCTVVSVAACTCVVLFRVFAFCVKSSACAQQVLCSNMFICIPLCVFQVYSVFLMQFWQCASIVVC